MEFFGDIKIKTENMVSWFIFKDYVSALVSRHKLYPNNLGQDVKVKGFPGGSDSKESAWNAGDPGSIPGLGKSPGDGNGLLTQYLYLKWAEA